MSQTDTPALVQSLCDLGFSQYEAKCYVGLMSARPQTGYGVAKATGVPQPKVYETLRKLASRGFVKEIAGEPTLFTAIPPDQLLRQLEDSFERRLGDARESVEQLAASEVPREIEYVERFDTREETVHVAIECLRAATRRVYLSASASELEDLAESIRAAVAREVDVVVLAFGKTFPDLPGVRVFHHASTQGALFRHHQAHHVALVVDSRQTINAVAADGSSWHGIRTSSAPVIAAVKGFIRHDIDMQQVFADFGPQLLDAYGPGLQALESYRQDQPSVLGKTVAGDEQALAETLSSPERPGRRTG
jgi:sugar-specific transcriptional regulator TrmB